MRGIKVVTIFLIYYLGHIRNVAAFLQVLAMVAPFAIDGITSLIKNEIDSNNDHNRRVGIQQAEAKFKREKEEKELLHKKEVDELKAELKRAHSPGGRPGVGGYGYGDESNFGNDNAQRHGGRTGPSNHPEILHHRKPKIIPGADEYDYNGLSDDSSGYYNHPQPNPHDGGYSPPHMDDNSDNYSSRPWLNKNTDEQHGTPLGYADSGDNYSHQGYLQPPAQHDNPRYPGSSYSQHPSHRPHQSRREPSYSQHNTPRPHRPHWQARHTDAHGPHTSPEPVYEPTSQSPQYPAHQYQGPNTDPNTDPYPHQYTPAQTSHHPPPGSYDHRRYTPVYHHESPPPPSHAAYQQEGADPRYHSQYNPIY